MIYLKNLDQILIYGGVSKATVQLVDNCKGVIYNYLKEKDADDENQFDIQLDDMFLLDHTSEDMVWSKINVRNSNKITGHAGVYLPNL